MLCPFQFLGASLLNFKCLDTLWAQSNIQVKCYVIWVCRGFLVQFRVSQYIMDLHWTSESKVMAVWIFQVLLCWILSVSIHYGPQSYIWVKCYGCLNLTGACMFNFECLDILWVSIGHPCQMLWWLEFAQGFLVQFWVSRYIMGLHRTSESKVMLVLICPGIYCSIFSVSIYYGPQLNI